MRLTGFEENVIDLFWQLSGEDEPFPRDLERPLALALPIALVKLPRLRLWDIERWMRQRGSLFRFDCESRSVKGCLIAQSGQGLMFVDGADPLDEQRFTVAHEIGHFLCDYWIPRTTATAKFGPGILSALDGLRPLTVTERVQSVLVGTRVGSYQSLMERNANTNSEVVWKAEDRADRIAVALLAPPDAVLPQLNSLSEPYSTRLERTVAVLHASFGLPQSIAAMYAGSLLAMVGKGPSWVESLGLR